MVRLICESENRGIKSKPDQTTYWIQFIEIVEWIIWVEKKLNLELERYLNCWRSITIIYKVTHCTQHFHRALNDIITSNSSKNSKASRRRRHGGVSTRPNKRTSGVGTKRPEKKLDQKRPLLAGPSSGRPIIALAATNNPSCNRNEKWVRPSPGQFFAGHFIKVCNYTWSNIFRGLLSATRF